MSLYNTPLHNAVKRAFPQSRFDICAIALLSLYEDGEDIVFDTLGTKDQSILHDLATAGLIEFHRYPKFNREMFGGFVRIYRYKINLDYAAITATPPVFDYWYQKRKKSLIWAIVIFGGLAVLSATIIACLYK